MVYGLLNQLSDAYKRNHDEFKQLQLIIADILLSYLWIFKL